MAIKSLVLLAFFAIPGASFGNDKCTKGSEFEPRLCPLPLEKISTIQIEENGAKSELEKDATIDCSGFKLDNRKVRKFLSRAKVVKDKQEVHYKLNWSPCSSSGTLKFVSGKNAQWSISQFGSGWLRIEANDDLTLYCRTCHFKPLLN
jgi:hypothetical protein